MGTGGSGSGGWDDDWNDEENPDEPGVDSNKLKEDFVKALSNAGQKKDNEQEKPKVGKLKVSDAHSVLNAHLNKIQGKTAPEQATLDEPKGNKTTNADTAEPALPSDLPPPPPKMSAPPPPPPPPMPPSSPVKDASVTSAPQKPSNVTAPVAQKDNTTEIAMLKRRLSMEYSGAKFEPEEGEEDDYTKDELAQINEIRNKIAALSGVATKAPAASDSPVQSASTTAAAAAVLTDLMKKRAAGQVPPTPVQQSVAATDVPQPASTVVAADVSAPTSKLDATDAPKPPPPPNSGQKAVDLSSSTGALTTPVSAIPDLPPPVISNPVPTDVNTSSPLPPPPIAQDAKPATNDGPPPPTDLPPAFPAVTNVSPVLNEGAAQPVIANPSPTDSDVPPPPPPADENKSNVYEGSEAAKHLGLEGKAAQTYDEIISSEKSFQRNISAFDNDLINKMLNDFDNLPQEQRKGYDKVKFESTLRTLQTLNAISQLIIKAFEKPDLDEAGRLLLATKGYYATLARDYKGIPPALASKQYSTNFDNLKLDGNAIAIQGVQRAPRYELLLRDLMNRAPKEHPIQDAASQLLEKAQAINFGSNLTVRQAANREMMAAINQSVDKRQSSGRSLDIKSLFIAEIAAQFQAQDKAEKDINLAKAIEEAYRVNPEYVKLNVKDIPGFTKAQTVDAIKKANQAIIDNPITQPAPAIPLSQMHTGVAVGAAAAAALGVATPKAPVVDDDGVAKPTRAAPSASAPPPDTNAPVVPAPQEQSIDALEKKLMDFKSEVIDAANSGKKYGDQSAQAVLMEVHSALKTIKENKGNTELTHAQISDLITSGFQTTASAAFSAVLKGEKPAAPTAATVSKPYVAPSNENTAPNPPRTARSQSIDIPKENNILRRIFNRDRRQSAPQPQRQPQAAPPPAASAPQQPVVAPARPTAAAPPTPPPAATQQPVTAAPPPASVTLPPPPLPRDQPAPPPPPPAASAPARPATSSPTTPPPQRQPQAAPPPPPPPPAASAPARPATSSPTTPPPQRQPQAAPPPLPRDQAAPARPATAAPPTPPPVTSTTSPIVQTTEPSTPSVLDTSGLSNAQKSKLEDFKKSLQSSLDKKFTAEQKAEAAKPGGFADQYKTNMKNMWEQTKKTFMDSELPKDENEAFAQLLLFLMQLFALATSPGNQLLNTAMKEAWGEMKAKYHERQADKHDANYNNVAHQEERLASLNDLLEISTNKIADLEAKVAQDGRPQYVQELEFEKAKNTLLIEARDNTLKHIATLKNDNTVNLDTAPTNPDTVEEVDVVDELEVLAANPPIPAQTASNAPAQTASNPLPQPASQTLPPPPAPMQQPREVALTRLDKDIESQFFNAILSGNHEQLRSLAKNHDANLVYPDITLINIAKAMGNQEAVKILKDNGADAAYAQRVDLTKQFGHVLNLSGEMNDQIRLKDGSVAKTKNNAEFGRALHAMAFFEQHFQNFNTKNNINTPFSNQVNEAVKFAKDHYNKTLQHDYAAFNDRMANHPEKPTYLPSGYSSPGGDNHNVGVIFYKDKLIVCDGGQQNNIAIYEVGKLNQMAVRALLNAANKEQYLDVLNNITRGKEVQNIPSNGQQFNNCTYINLAGAVQGLNYVQKCEGMSGPEAKMAAQKAAEKERKQFNHASKDAMVTQVQSLMDKPENKAYAMQLMYNFAKKYETKGKIGPKAFERFSEFFSKLPNNERTPFLAATNIPFTDEQKGKLAQLPHRMPNLPPPPITGQQQPVVTPPPGPPQRFNAPPPSNSAPANDAANAALNVGGPPYTPMQNRNASTAVASVSQQSLSELITKLDEVKSENKLASIGIKDYTEVKAADGKPTHVNIQMYCNKDKTDTTEVKAESKPGSDGVTYSMKGGLEGQAREQTIEQICALAVETAKPGTVLSIPSGNKEKREQIEAALDKAFEAKFGDKYEKGNYTIPEAGKPNASLNR